MGNAAVRRSPARPAAARPATARPGRVVVRVLGPVTITVDDHAVVLSQLERGLLALIAARAGQVVSVDRLIDALWDDAAPRSARNRVQALVSSLRRAVAKVGGAVEPVLTSPPGYRLNTEALQVDLVEFDHRLGRGRRLAAAGDREAAIHEYQSALALWHGNPFDGVQVGRDADLQVEEVRLQEERLVAVEERVELELSLGHHGELAPELSALVAANPLRERLRCLLMLALARAGRQAEALATYRSAYHLLTEELGTGPGPQLRAAHRAILTGDVAGELAADVATELAADELAGRGKRAPQKALPADLPDFTGRAAELSRIQGWLTGFADRSVVVSISGPEGVGKTAIGVRLAHLCVQRYSDGCLFVDLRGTEAVPLASVQAMVAILQWLDMSATLLPGGLEGIAVAYRATLADRQILLVLDNAADETQVRPLVAPGAGSATIVTSRSCLDALDGAQHMCLAGLPARDGLALLAQVLGRARVLAEPRAANRLVDLCGRLPLAVRVAAVRLAHQPELTIAAMVERMTDLHDHLDRLLGVDRQARASFLTSLSKVDPRSSPGCSSFDPTADAVLRLAGWMLAAPEPPAWVLAALAALPPSARGGS